MQTNATTLFRTLMARTAAVAWLAVLWPVAQAQPAEPTLVGPVVWSVLGDTILQVEGTDGRIHLVYELHIANASHFTVDVPSIEVLDAKDGRATGLNRVLSADGKDVSGMVRAFAVAQPTQDAVDYARQLGPGQGGVVYFNVTYAAAGDVPRRLQHRIVASIPVPGAAPRVFNVVDAGTAVSADTAIAIAPPLKGDNWVAANGSGSVVSPHRYTIQPTNGRLRAPEHFAIDFIRLDAQSRAYVGDMKDVKSWSYYGAEIVSSTPGRVVQVLADMQDGVPGQLPAQLATDQYAGNHVIVDIGNGRFALYAHLAPGSVAVKLGDTVRVGQLLGRLGNTGNSDAPHLHFQIMNSASALNTHGLPFVFDRMKFQGRIAGPLDAANDAVFSGKPVPVEPQGAGARGQQMPLTFDVVGFN